jgi:type IV secretory pathway VirB6-like protein
MNFFPSGSFKRFIKNLLLILVATSIITSCKGKDKGCVSKDIADQGTGAIGSSAAGIQQQFNKGVFGTWLASLIIGQLTTRIYGDSSFWKTNDVDAGKGMLQKTNSSGFNGIIHSTVKNFLGDKDVKLVVSMCIILYITLYGVGIIVGTKSIAIKDVLPDVFRIFIVILFTSARGWDYYFDFIIRPLLFGAKYLAYKFNVSLSGGANPETPFGLLDQALFYVFSPLAMEKILAFVISGYFGFFYLIAIMFAVLSLLILNFRGILLYASTMVIAGFMLCAGPIFIVMLIFDRTKDFFKTWFKALAALSLQQFMIYIVLILTNYILIAFIKTAMFYEVCWGTVLGMTFKIPLPSWLATIFNTEYILKVTIPFMFGYKFLPSVSNPYPDILTNIGCLIVMSLASQKMLDAAVEISGALISGGINTKAGAIGAMYDKSAALNKGLNEGAAALAWENAKAAYSNVADKISGKGAQDNVKRIEDRNKNIAKNEEKIKELEEKGGFLNNLEAKLRKGKNAIDELSNKIDGGSNVTNVDLLGNQAAKNAVEKNKKNNDILNNVKGKAGNSVLTNYENKLDKYNEAVSQGEEARQEFLNNPENQDFKEARKTLLEQYQQDSIKNGGMVAINDGIGKDGMIRGATGSEADKKAMEKDFDVYNARQAAASKLKSPSGASGSGSGAKSNVISDNASGGDGEDTNRKSPLKEYAKAGGKGGDKGGGEAGATKSIASKDAAKKEGEGESKASGDSGSGSGDSGGTPAPENSAEGRSDIEPTIQNNEEEGGGGGEGEGEGEEEGGGEGGGEEGGGDVTEAEEGNSVGGFQGSDDNSTSSEEGGGEGSMNDSSDSASGDGGSFSPNDNIEFEEPARPQSAPSGESAAPSSNPPPRPSSAPLKRPKRTTNYMLPTKSSDGKKTEKFIGRGGKIWKK